MSWFHPVALSTLGAAEQQGLASHPQTGEVPEAEVGPSPTDLAIHEGGAHPENPAPGNWAGI